MGRAIRITQESRPPRGNSIVQVTHKKKSSLIDKVKFLTVKILYLTVYDDDDDDNNADDVT
jgi:hypothetical protein